MPCVGTCVCRPSHARHSRWNVGHVLAIVHGFLSGCPARRAAWLTRPYMHPSSLCCTQLHDRSAALTCLRRQYIHARGHSMAICPPRLRQEVATMWKFFHNARKIAQWARILVRVFGPRYQFRCRYGDPPVRGSAPNRSTGRSVSVTALRALARPASDVISSSIVRRTTSQSGGANCPIRDS